jgi:DNA-binding transcriptional LysR family regulator
VRLRDLHILFAVVQHGSMAKAGAYLAMSQSAVSQAIAAIEHTLGVRLLDRGPRGVEPTIYCSTLLRRGQAAFDELRSGIKEIESLADPGSGEVRIAAGEAIAAGVLSQIIERMLRRYPRIKLNMMDHTTTGQYSELIERKADVRFSLLLKPLESSAIAPLATCLSVIWPTLLAGVFWQNGKCVATPRQRRLNCQRTMGPPHLHSAHGRNDILKPGVAPYEGKVWWPGCRPFTEDLP